MADREEQYVLRIQDKAVAARIRKQLNQEHSKAKLDIRLDGTFNCQEQIAAAALVMHLNLFHWCYWVELNNTLFPVASHSDGRTGQFTFGSEVLPVTLLDLPCVVESYKTYDDSHLVKMCDVGQVGSLSLQVAMLCSLPCVSQSSCLIWRASSTGPLCVHSFKNSFAVADAPCANRGD